jgi:hypothetical protein
MRRTDEEGGIKSAIIITVGVSLLENLWYQNLVDSSKRTQYLNKAEILPVLKDNYEIFYGNFFDALNNNYNNPFQVDFPSAEIESFVYWLAEYDQINLKKIILLYTNTDKAKACACMIRDVICGLIKKCTYITNKMPGCEPDIVLQPFSFEVDNTEKFPEDVGTFINLIEEKIEALKKDNIRRVVLNITAGYKILVSISSLFAFLKDEIEVIYKHEDTKNLLRVPPLPLDWNYKLFDEYRSLVMRPGGINFVPPPQLAGLFNKRRAVWVKNEYGVFLTNLYDSERMKRFGLGKRLSRLLSPESQQKLNDHKLPQWIHLWIGDQIPETVEHSRAHSSRLLEYAADLIEVMFSDNENFLSDKELLILIYCFWLHDLGHTGLYYRLNKQVIPVGMYPSLVRKWHSFITFQQLMDGEYLDEEEKVVVSEICKYHRGRLPLKKGQKEELKKWQDSIFTDLALPPLEEHLETIRDTLVFSGVKIQENRILLLCALLRICDALDMQSDRVVDQHYWNVRKRRTREEVVHYLKHYERTKLLTGLTSDSYKRELEKLEGNLNECIKIWEKLDTWEKAQEVENIINQEIEDMLLRLIGQALEVPVTGGQTLGLDPEGLQVAAEQLSLLDRITFKMRQEAHFYKHSSVSLVYLTREAAKLWINMLFEPALGVAHKMKLAKEIWNELSNDNHNDVEDILEKAGIEFAGIKSEGIVLIKK